MSVISNHVYLVILAGGSGTRFWPKSRQLLPKQLCKIGGGKLTMLEKTLARFDGFIPPERRMIVTHAMQIAATRDIAGSACQNFIAEPEAKNTANALCLAALEIEQKARIQKSSKPAIMISVHADHLIQNVEQFLSDLKLACEVAEKGFLTLLGVKPEYPETGYGYIEAGSNLEDQPSKVYHVASFKEKPDVDTAQKYVESGRYFWNSGLFVWHTKLLLDELKKYLPMPVEKLSACLSDYQSFADVPPSLMKQVYSELPKIAIDHAVLELSQHVAVIETQFGWKDVGSWDALATSFPVDPDGNYISGDCIVLDSRNVTAESDGPLIATIGMRDTVIVATKDAVMVCPTSRAQEVKKFVERLQDQGRSELL